MRAPAYVTSVVCWRPWLGLWREPYVSGVGSGSLAIRTWTVTSVVSKFAFLRRKSAPN